MRWHGIITVLVTCWLLSQPLPAQAEILLDDFDVPSQLILPEDLDHPFIFDTGIRETDSVGDLDLTQTLFVSTNGTQPIGSLDSALTNPSALHFDLPDPNWFDSPFSHITFGVVYQKHEESSERQPFDISDGGRNNVFIFDFNRVAIDGDPAVIRFDVLVTAHGTQWFAPAFSELPPHAKPFSVVIPFNSFRRESAPIPPPVPSFTDAEEIGLSFRAHRFVDSASLQLDSIRVGRDSAIPEPLTFMIATIAFVAVPRFIRHCDVRRFQRAVTMLAICLLLGHSPPARAEFILDDFDTPSQLILPEDLDHPFIFDTGISETDFVGDLNLARILFVSTNGSQPMGSLDSALTNTSALHFDLPTPNWLDSPFSYITSGVVYQTHEEPGERQPFDIGDGGRNNAFIFDFNHVVIDGDPAVLRFRVLVWAHGTQWFAPAFSELTQDAEPFSIVVPFDSFRREGGGGPPPPVPSFTDAEEIVVNFRAYRFVDSASVQLDSIRVGHALEIPEPSSLLLACCGMIALAVYAKLYCRRVRPPC